jgi:hypothetical protein
VIKQVVERIDKTGKILNEYNHLKSLNTKDHFNMVYPDHKEKYAPVFKLDVDREIEILANKFRIMSTPGVQTVKSPVRASHLVGTRTFEEMKGSEYRTEAAMG